MERILNNISERVKAVTREKSTAAVTPVCWQVAEKGSFSPKGAASWGSLCPAPSKKHRATTSLWLQMKSKSFKAALPEASAIFLLPAAPFIRPRWWLVSPRLGTQTTKLAPFIYTGCCGEVGWLPALSVPWLSSGLDTTRVCQISQWKKWPRCISDVETPVNFFFWSNLDESIFLTLSSVTQFLALLVPRGYLVPTAASVRDYYNLGRPLPNLCIFSLEKDGDEEIQWHRTSSRLLVLCFKPECLDKAAIISVVSDLTGSAALPDQRNTSKHYQNYDNSFI